MRRHLLHIGLFLAACVTTYLFAGPYFSATLMSILLCHELGHYVVGRRRGVPMSLPYFIPLPPGISLGTMGAVIQMDEPIEDRNALFDVGASGPLAGLVVAIPLLIVGLSMSHVAPSVPNPDTTIEGNSILYALIKYAMFGWWLPGDGLDVQLHPMAFAAWVGLLITAINLLPIGQLDGGHIAKALLGERHEKMSLYLNIGLPIFGVVQGSAMALVAHSAGKSVIDSLDYGKSGAIPWLLWSALLYVMRQRAGMYHTPVGDKPLSPGRRRAAIAMLILCVVLFIPVPFRPVL